MIDQEYIKFKCYEIAEEEKRCKQWRKEFEERVDSLKRNDFWLDGIVDCASEYQTRKMVIDSVKFHVHQMIWAMDNKEYKSLWNKIVEGVDDEAV